jgi:hypothetical protein
MNTTDAVRATDPKIDRLLAEIDGLIRDDDSADRELTGAWRTFDAITAAANASAWDAYSVDLSVDAASYRSLGRVERAAMLRLFGTLYRAESIVDDWMVRIVAALPREAPGEARNGLGYDAMRDALKGQEHDEKMHRGSLFRVATEVFGIAPGDVDRVAQRNNNFVAETLFARFDRQMAQLLRPGRTLADLYTAIFIYGVLSEDVVANSDVVIRRAKANDKYTEFNLPGMREGQTNVRRDEGRHVRIAVLATHKFLDEQPGADGVLVDTCREYLDLADRMLRRAKASHGLIDAHLRESYGPDVDSLYYFVMNLKRLAVRLDELGLYEGVRDVKRRVDRAVAEFGGPDAAAANREPGRLVRAVGPLLLRFARDEREEPGVPSVGSS